MDTEDTKLSAVYVAWTTFSNAIGLLADALPNRIDKTVFGTKAGAVQGQLVTGLKFLGLIAKDGKPTDALRALAVKDEAERKRQMAKVLKASYPNLFALDLTKTTQGELREEMTKSYGVTGNTTDRAIRFFIAAAEYAGISLSALVSKVGSAPINGGSTTTRRRRTPRQKRERIVTPAGDGGGTPAGTSKSIKLASGGMLTVSATLDLFSLSQQDRRFVFDLIDKLDGYPGGGKEEGHEEPEN